MDKKDNTVNGFSELLGKVNKELAANKGTSSAKSPASEQIPGGTTVFNTVKSGNNDTKTTVVKETEKLTTTGKSVADKKSSITGFTDGNGRAEKSSEAFLPPEKNNGAENNRTRVMPLTSASPETNKTETSGTSRPAHGTPVNSAGRAVSPAPHKNTTIPKNTDGGKTTVMPAVQNNKSKTQNSGKRKRKKGSSWSGLLKFIIYIIFVGIISVLIAKYCISVGNDVFAFIKESYNFTDTVYSVKGETDNSLRITETKLNGDKFEFSYAFASPLTTEQLKSVDATLLITEAHDNSLVHNYGKFSDKVAQGKPISIDLSNAKLYDGEYVLRFTVNTGEGVQYITEFTMSKIIKEVSVEKDASTGDVAKELKKAGIIKHPAAFKLYVYIKKDGKDVTYLDGEHMLYSGMDYDEIIYSLTPRASARSIVKLTFPEGSTTDEIINILIKGGVQNSKADYAEALNNLDLYDYQFIDLLKQKDFKDGRVYALEGYLFPDTYEFYTDSSPAAVINKFLANFNAKFDSSFYEEAAKLGMSVDDIVTIASLVENEAGNADDKGDIASVFHNRLKNPSVYQYLESDATTDYASFDLKANLKFTEYKCSKCGEKSVKNDTKCSKCGNSNTFENYRCASFSTDLSNYNLSDGNYYINFNIKANQTRSVVLIDINKKTENEKAVFTVTSKSATDTPSNGDMKVTVTKADITSKNVLNCEFKLDHNYDADSFMKFAIKLNLFRTAYNTYLSKGIMPSAVSNPGYDSIIAAIYPNTTNYYFFVADNTGKSHFTSTNAAHEAKIAELQRKGIAYGSN